MTISATRETRRLFRRPSPVLTYHIIAPERSRYVYSLSSDWFEDHLSLFADLGANDSGTLPQVTFDDGGISDYEFALPLLNKHKICGTFFVTAGLIEKEPGFMSWDQIRRIASAGHCVQSHGWSHLLLTRASPLELQNELEWSKKLLEDRLGLPINAISLPGGRWNPGVLGACAKAGYSRVYHSDPWLPDTQFDGANFVGRLMVRNTMSADRIRRLLAGDSKAILALRVQHKLKQEFRRLVGDDRYHRLWRGVRRLTQKSSGEMPGQQAAGYPIAKGNSGSGEHS
jgi:peptidoglycan/xylan/chitin deacetylase (PgdA/CDA1 family)